WSPEGLAGAFENCRRARKALERAFATSSTVPERLWGGRRAHEAFRTALRAGAASAFAVFEGPREALRRTHACARGLARGPRCLVVDEAAPRDVAESAAGRAEGPAGPEGELASRARGPSHMSCWRSERRCRW